MALRDRPAVGDGKVAEPGDVSLVVAFFFSLHLDLVLDQVTELNGLVRFEHGMEARP